MSEPDSGLRRAKECFERASRLPPEDRAAYLNDLRDEDAPLAGVVEQLLLAERAVARDDYLAPGSASVANLLETGPGEGYLGQTLGPYEINDVLGSGGMGTVYQATRRDDYAQLVAIKVVKRGMDTDAVLRRFRNERQTLASLDHPNIARLLDGGSTDDGRPYFVMEHVDGVPISEYCDAHHLPVEDRIRLMTKVCSAVAHAHDRIIVHRDLKPANILVTPEGEPKLLDFGLARLLSSSIGFPALELTRPGEQFLTVSYASPEQIRGEVVDRTADVYALGVILYELLAGRRPYAVAGMSPPEAARFLAYARPPWPSAMAARKYRAHTAGGGVRIVTPEDVARARATTPRALRRTLARDLDNIARMAIQSESRDRYPDAHHLERDLRCWLDDKPVLARRESWWYVTRKFVRRNRIIVTAAASVMAILFVALVVTTSLLVDLQRTQREKEKAKGVALEAMELADTNEELARRESRKSLSKGVAIVVLLDLVADDPELELLLAIEAVRLWPTPAAEFALRRTMARRQPSVRIAGHDTFVIEAVFSHDGRRIVSVSRDGTARIWDAGTGRQVAELLGHEGPVLGAAFFPDGRLVATVGADGSVRLWETATGALRRIMAGHEGAVHEVAVSRDGRWVLTVGRDTTARLWDAEDGTERARLEGSEGWLLDAAFAPDGELVVAAGRNGIVRVLRRADRAIVATLTGHGDAVRDASFRGDGARIVTASDDGTARVWTLAGLEVGRLSGHLGRVQRVRFSPDGRWIVTCGDDDTVRVWDAGTGDLLRKTGGHSAEFSPDGKWLLVARSGGSVHALSRDMFAPLDMVLEEARGIVGERRLTPEERSLYVRELTEQERAELFRRPPAAVERLQEETILPGR